MAKREPREQLGRQQLGRQRLVGAVRTNSSSTIANLICSLLCHPSGDELSSAAKQPKSNGVKGDCVE